MIYPNPQGKCCSSKGGLIIYLHEIFNYKLKHAITRLNDRSPLPMFSTCFEATSGGDALHRQR